MGLGMDHTQRTIRSVRQQLSTVLFARYGLAAAAAILFAWGVVVLVLRVGWQVERLPLAWGAVALIGAVVYGLVIARRRMPTERQVRAMVDRQSQAGGLVMAADETDTGAWQTRTQANEVPTIHWRGQRTAGLVGAAVAFVAIAFVIPDQFTALADTNKLDISEEVAQLDEQIELLEEENVIDSDEAASMSEKLEQIETEATGADPTRTWEALDHLTERLNKEAEEAAENAINDTERMNRVETLAEAIQKAGDQLNPEAMAGAMQQLQDEMNEAAANNDAFKESLDEKLKEDIEAGTQPEAHFDFDVAKMTKLQEKVQDLESLQHKDPKDLTPAEALKLADLMRQVQKLSEKELKQLAALEAASLAMRKMNIGAIAEVDADANVRFYEPAQKVTLKQAQDPELGDSFAVRVKQGGATEQFSENMLVDGEPFTIPADVFEGTPIALTHNEQGKMVVYVGKPSQAVDFEKLADLPGENIVFTQGGEDAKLYGPDENAQFNPNCLGGACQNAKDSKVSRAVLMQKLAASNMIDPKQLEQLQQMGQGNPGAAEALAQFLAEQGGEGQGGMDQGMLQAALSACMKPGNSGINRGRGDAPMTWKDPTNLENAGFNEQTLPPAALAALRDSLKTGTSVSAPELADPNTTATSGALNNAQAGGGSAQTQTVLPRHRGAVENYFNRD
jgi:hypothetical protein